MLKRLFLLPVFAFMLCSTVSAQKWDWLDVSYKELTSGLPKYFFTRADSVKKWWVVRFDKDLASEESKFAIVRFLNDMGCTVEKVTKLESGGYNYSWSFIGNSPIVYGRLYVNGAFGYAVIEDQGFSVYPIEPYKSE